ncbi:MAG: metal-sensing transcriptional repressor [Anaerovoracaceae bacterium]|jgi:DNA-binding FrmR family transcriptional regulator
MTKKKESVSAPDNEECRELLEKEAEETASCCSDRKKYRSDEEFKALSNRLCRIEGQVRGLKKMLEEDAYCPDILVQVSAVKAALDSFSRVLLSNHIRTCVVDDIKDGKDETVDELVNVVQKLMK